MKLILLSKLCHRHALAQSFKYYLCLEVRTECVWFHSNSNLLFFSLLCLLSYFREVLQIAKFMGVFGLSFVVKRKVIVAIEVEQPF